MSTGFIEPTTTAEPAQLERDEVLYEIVNGERVDLPPMSIYAHLIAGGSTATRRRPKPESLKSQRSSLGATSCRASRIR